MLQIHLVSALLGFGVALCWCHVVWELDFHTLQPGRAAALPLGALGCGAIGGVILPALLLRQRGGWLAARGDTLDAAGGVLCGLLLLPCGIAWGLVVGYAGVFESLRGVMAGALTLPPGVMLTLLWTPMLVALLAAGASLGIACAALHGWKRELGLVRRFQSAIWPALLVAGAAAGLLAEAEIGERWPPIVGVALIFAAAVAATIRTAPRRDSRPAPASSDVGSAAGGGTIALFSVVIAGANVAAALLCAVRPEREGQGIGGATAALCLATALAFAGPIQRLRGWILSPVFLCAGAALVWAATAWLPPTAGGQKAAARLALVGFCAVLALLVAARQLAVHLGGTRRGLAACVAFGGLGALLAAALGPIAGAPAESGFTMTLFTALACALLMIAERHAAFAVRGTGVLLAAVAIVGIAFAPRGPANLAATVAPGAARPAAQASSGAAHADVEEHAPPFVERIVQWLQGVPSLQSVVAAPGVGAALGDEWRAGLLLDLAPRAVDIVIVRPPKDGQPLSAESAARLAHRWFAGLRAGGRIVVLSATADVAEAVIWEWKRHRRETRMEAFRIIWASDDATEALAIGSDIPALLTAALPGEFGSPQVQSVSGFRQFMQLRAEAQNK